MNDNTATIRIEASDLAVPPHAMVPWEYEIRFTGPSAPRFSRGDANGDKSVDIADAVRLLLFLFTSAPSIGCEDAADIQDDGIVDLSDPVSLLGYLFLRAAAPAAPFGDCGLDPSGDALPCLEPAACQQP